MNPDVTQQQCPDAPRGGIDNRTHHLIPTVTGDMVCTYCKRTRADLMKPELTAAKVTEVLAYVPGSVAADMKDAVIVTLPDSPSRKLADTALRRAGFMVKDSSQTDRILYVIGVQ